MKALQKFVIRFHFFLLFCPFAQTAKRKRGHIKNKLALRKGKKLQKK